MTEFLIHCGMPKTGTSVLQAALAGSGDLLGAAGVLYPSHGRIGTAHHGLALALREEGPDAPAAHAAQLLAEVAARPGGPPRLAVCSSEQFSNLFSETRLPQLTGFVGGLGHSRTRTVVVLREYTAFIESMYLQGARFRADRTGFDTFLQRLVASVPNLLQALAALQAELGQQFEAVLADPAFEVLSVFDGLLGLDPGTLKPLSRDRDATAKPTLKVQAVLSNLAWVEEGVGFRISRKRLFRQVRGGRLAFRDDVSAYTIYAPGQRRAAAQALVPVMRAHGFGAFADLSEPHAADDAAPLPFHAIETAAISTADLDLLVALRDKIEDKAAH